MFKVRSLVEAARSGGARTLGPVVALAIAGVVVVPGLVTPASATDVSDLSTLQTTLSTCSSPTVATLTQTLTGPTAPVEVACDATIDLHGFGLTVRNVVVDAGKTLTVTDSTSSSPGTLTADATSADNTAGIQTSGATLVTSGTAHVVATGGARGAGIGGTAFGSSGTVTSNDASTITAFGGASGAGIGGGDHGPGGTTISNDTSVIMATGSYYGAGIGGGYSGPGGTTTVNDSSSLTATGGAGGGAGIGGGIGETGGTTTISGGTVTAVGGSSALTLGHVDITGGTLRLPSGNLVVGNVDPAGPEIVVGAHGTITGSSDAVPTYATIIGNGQIQNDGVITLPTANIAPTSVTHRHYTVTFDTQGGSAAPGPVTVYADTFAHGDRVFPSNPTRPGYTFSGWYTQPDGAGTRITATSTLPGTSADGTAVAITAYAYWPSTTTPPPTSVPVVVPTPVITNTTSGTRGTASPEVGDILATTTGATTPAGATLTYQWTRTSSTGVATAIPGATAASYTTSEADLGSRLTVTVTATPTTPMTGYTPGHATSAPTGPIQASSGTPTPGATIPDPHLIILGTSRVGRTLTGTITRPDIPGLTLTWQWQHRTTRTDRVIPHATHPRYTPNPRQVHYRLRLVLTLGAPGYTPLTVHGDPLPVTRGLLRTAVPVITGIDRPGHTLAARVHRGGHLPAGYRLRYHWNIDGHRIRGHAAHRTYRVRPGQLGSYLTVTTIVTAPGYRAVHTTSHPRLVRPSHRHGNRHR